jgi:hypothetical protein
MFLATPLQQVSLQNFEGIYSACRHIGILRFKNANKLISILYILCCEILGSDYIITEEWSILAYYSLSTGK